MPSLPEGVQKIHFYFRIRENKFDSLFSFFPMSRISNDFRSEKYFGTAQVELFSNPDNILLRLGIFIAWNFTFRKYVLSIVLCQKQFRCLHTRGTEESVNQALFEHTIWLQIVHWITSSIHENSKLKPGEIMLCKEIVSDIQNNFCTQHVLPMFCKKKSFWQRFTCNEWALCSPPYYCQSFSFLGSVQISKVFLDH